MELDIPYSSKYAKQPQRAGITLEDPVSSCDEFPRPLGPMLKYIAKGQLQATRRKAAVKGVKTNQARKSEKRNKALTQGKRRPAAKVAKKRALTTTKARKPKATGIIDVNRSHGEEKSVESNDRPWWRFLFGKKNDDEKIFQEVQKDKSTPTKTSKRIRPQ